MLGIQGIASLPIAGTPAIAGANFTGTTVAGSKAINGQVSTIIFARNFTTVAGTKPLTGQVSSIVFARNLTTVAGGLIKTGQVSYIRVPFITVPGNIVKTGQVATLSIFAPSVGGSTHSWYVKGIGIKTKTGVPFSQVDGDTGDVP
jgi:hypothetical protein